MPISQGSHAARLQRERRLQRAKPAGWQPLEPTHEEEEARAHLGGEVTEHVEELCDSRAHLPAIISEDYLGDSSRWPDGATWATRASLADVVISLQPSTAVCSRH